ncbi:hypothetical protein M4951_14520 [Blastopirellula sp. J2-11]|uniref:hypothetical protein n=1 Tax=Blastopirellula sp. J2-11 TaxID=2943192 RepID=UPI0021CA9C97|nr:hypothetical protein [Blastopirellula sp. J2-11]UUO04604.1 hypothetical protein M4951_14520 [Blastopirellula sp. J2-11]
MLNLKFASLFKSLAIALIPNRKMLHASGGDVEVPVFIGFHEEIGDAVTASDIVLQDAR